MSLKHVKNIVVLIAAFAVVLTMGCTDATAKKLILSANQAQAAAATTYDAAKTQEAAASADCKDALKLAGKPMPPDASQIVATCAAVGVKIPFNPVALQKLAAPVNALYDGVRAANEERLNIKAGKGSDMLALYSKLAGLFAAVIGDLTSAGLTVPPIVQQAAADLQAAGVK